MPVLLKKQDTFATDERGTVAVLFGLMFTVLTFSAGMAIDYGRVVHTQTKFSAAVDAATLAAGRALLSGGTEAEAEAIAIKFLEENVDAGALHATYATPVVDVDVATGGVTVSVSPVVQMTLTSILGFDTITVPVTASTKFDQQDIELGMQLDLTGSMCQPCSKIDALKEATANLIEILMPDAGTQNKVRIGLAPYSAGINVGDYAEAVIDGYNGGNTCAYDRKGASADTDAMPEQNHYFQGKAQIAGAGQCPTAKVVPLSNDKAALKTAVSNFTTGGTTAGQIGTNWAWNLISPKWNDIWPLESKPVAYKDGKTLKAVILMTDGEYNTFEGKCDNSGCTPYGSRGKKSNDHAKDLCANMKAEGVVVYTVGFQINHPAAIDTLSTCATSADHYFVADDAAALTEAFVAIAQQLNNLRLTN